MINTIKAILATIIISTLPSAAFADEGIWEPATEFAQLSLACSRLYHCVPESALIYSGEKMISGDKKIVFGVCSADGGAIDSCNRCLTSAPSESCEWVLIDR